MREHIARLEARVRELENPEQSAPSMTLFDPHALSPYYSESSSSSSYDSPGGKLSYSASASPTPFPLGEQDARNMMSPLSVSTPEVDASVWESLNFGNLSSAPGVNSFNNMETPPLDHILLEIFIPHRHQCGLDIHVGRLRDSMNLSPAEQHHPVLMNAICLWACYLTRPGSLSQYEQLYLSRTTAAIGDAMQYPSKAVDLIQACCMLSVYYLSNGRLLEGSYYSAAACTLALQCRLHHIGSDAPSMNVDTWDASFDLPPPNHTATCAVPPPSITTKMSGPCGASRSRSGPLAGPLPSPRASTPDSTPVVRVPQSLRKSRHRRGVACGAHAQG
ncbi:hypothetical protein NUW54_g13283 [Trametes sanguinea]|uniref:Uncharacterized protein n=1 Tax=Trametes sanguinea TaxID=158606 RepID=A0ACC1MNK9_9APHY|nr:hypothetical protein NUW54_g13283 [Trametes sanguinea]